MLVVPLLKVARSHQRPTQQFDAGAFLPNGQLFQSKDQIRSANKVSPFLCLPGWVCASFSIPKRKKASRLPSNHLSDLQHRMLKAIKSLVKLADSGATKHQAPMVYDFSKRLAPKSLMAWCCPLEGRPAWWPFCWRQRRDDASYSELLSLIVGHDVTYLLQLHTCWSPTSFWGQVWFFWGATRTSYKFPFLSRCFLAGFRWYAPSLWSVGSWKWYR